MSEENKILIFLFLSVTFIYLIGFVFLRWLLRKKYKFPTQIPPPFFGVKEFSVFLKERATSGELCHKRTGHQSELVPPVRNGDSSLIINNFRSRTELVLTAEEDLERELRIIDFDNHSICDGEVNSTLQQSPLLVVEDSLCVQIEGLSKKDKEYEKFEHVTNIDFDECNSQNQGNNQVTGELYQVCKDLTIPEVLTHCSSRSKFISQKDEEEDTDVCTNRKDSKITDLHHDPMKGITPKENSKQNPQQLKSKKKKMVKGQWILKRWKKKKPQSEVDLSSSLINEGSVWVQGAQQTPENVAEEKVLPKDCKYQCKHSGKEELKRQNEITVVKNSMNKNEHQLSLKDNTKSFQNCHEESLNQLFHVKHKILQTEEERNEIVENSQLKNTPMLSMDEEDFLQDHQAEECFKKLPIDECKNRSETEQETFLILQNSKVEHNPLTLTVKEDNISQILNSPNIESFVICQFSDEKNGLKFSENQENSKPGIVDVDDANCYPLNLSLRKYEDFHPHSIEQIQSSEENVISKESNSLEAKFVTTKLEHESDLIEHQSASKIDNQLIENSKSTDDDENKSLKSKQSDAVQFSCQNISFTTNSSQEIAAQFPDQGMDIEIDSSFRNTQSVNNFIPEECKVPNIDFVLEVKKKSKKENNLVPKPLDGIKSLHQMLVSETFHHYQQQTDEDSSPLDCRLVKESEQKNNTYSDPNNLFTDILIPEEFNTSFVTQNSNSSKHNQNIQAAFSTYRDDATLHQNVFPTNNCLQEQFIFSSNLHRSEKLPEPKQTHLPFDCDSKQIPNSKHQIGTENKKMVSDFEDDFENFSENSFSEITSQQDLTNELLASQPINCLDNATTSPRHKLCVNIAEELNQTSLDEITKKIEPFKNSISSDIHMNEDSFSGISKIEKFTSESSTDVISHSKDKPGETKNPEVVKYITRSVKQVLLLTEDVVSETLEQEEKCNRCLIEDENSTTNSFKFPDNLSTFKKTICSTKDKKHVPLAASSAQRTRQARTSKDTGTKEQSGNDLAIFDKVSRISSTEELIPKEKVPQTHKTLSNCISNNAQPSERIPSPKQVHWLPGYVRPSPILSDLNNTEPVNSLAIKPVKDNGTPRNGILKSRYRSYNYDDQSNSTELETNLTTFEDSKLHPRIASTPQDCCQRDESFLYSSQYGYSQGRTKYWNDDYRNHKYTANIDNPGPTYIYSVPSSSSESPAMRDKYYSESNHYFTANKFISRSESPSFDSKRLESFTYENMRSNNEKLKSSSNSLNLEFSRQDDSYFDQSLKNGGNNTSLEQQRDEQRSCSSSSCYQGRYFSPLKDLGRFDTHPPSSRYFDHFKWSDAHSAPNYPAYADDEYDYWSYRRYQLYLGQLWYREHCWNDYLQSYAYPRHQLGYREWYNRRWWEDYLRYKERYWDGYWRAHRDSLRYKGYWEHSPGEYSMSDDRKRYLDIPKPNKEQNCDKQEYAEADDKDRRIEEKGEHLLDYRPAVRYKERNDKNAFKAQDKGRAESYRHKGNYLEERPSQQNKQKPREVFRLPRKREGYKEDSRVTESNEYVYKNLQGSLTHRKDGLCRERYRDHLYRPRYREKYWHDWSATRSSERHPTDLPIDEYKGKH